MTPWPAALIDRVPLIRSAAELDGFAAQLAATGTMTPELQAAVALRRAELARGR